MELQVATATAVRPIRRSANFASDSVATSHSVHPKYRPDIDGLRAVAVLFVVGFHAFPNLVFGGFIGVDVFFVISGFLISSIIFGNLERSSFSILEFYQRRVRRILPALIAVMTASLIFGHFELYPDEYSELADHVQGGSEFISNFLLLNESSYFDHASQTKPLLHLWSLGIEEQFYVFWPLLLAFVWRRHWNFLGLTLVIATTSIAANVYFISHAEQPLAFFSPQSRFWELMCGGALAYVALQKPDLICRWRGAQSGLGALLLLLGLLFVRRSQDYPGWHALIPVAGAFLLISAGPEAWFNRSVLSNRIAVAIGLISYPLYLWHWPLLTFARILGYSSPMIIVAAVAASFVLAALTYWVIETPLRRISHGTVKVFALLLALAALGFAGRHIHNHWGDGASFTADGGAKRDFYSYFADVPPGRFISVFENQFRDDCNFYDVQKAISGHVTSVPRAQLSSDCFTPDPAKDRRVFIWGDSHAQMLNVGLTHNLPGSWQVLQVASSGCPADPEIIEISLRDYCKYSNWFALKTISEVRPDVVIVAQNANHDVRKWHQIARKLRSLGVRRIIFTGPTPHWAPDLPRLILRRLWEDTPRRTFIGIDRTVQADDLALKRSFAPESGEHFLSLMDVFCDAQGCLTYLGADRKSGITSWDYGHLSAMASDYLARNALVDLVVGKDP